MSLPEKLTLIFIFCFPWLAHLHAQPHSKGQKQIYANIDQTIENINRMLGSNCKMEYKSELIVTFYLHGKPFRQDHADLDALDPNTVKYLPAEKSISIQCLDLKKEKKDIKEGCIFRENAKDKNKLYYSRMTLRVNDQNKVNELKAEIEKLIRYGHEILIIER